jgi:hypothetical protein
MDNFNNDVIARTLADINGVPMKIMQSQDVIAETRQGRAQQEQLQNAVNMAPPAADAALKIAQIADMGQG